ncbi:uncharacterized protein RSE6_00602 [Rhynchosporium secalis]|uniref:Uncharacterized protein n=1 Tax=Rhynchosporium secalis TaxID=38038 RepID=A0A1E1LVN4_RHYSE|nr:uncharacterized protein RSE6_00602 [Rhynchosporium secalis]
MDVFTPHIPMTQKPVKPVHQTMDLCAKDPLLFFSKSLFTDVQLAPAFNKRDHLIGTGLAYDGSLIIRIYAPATASSSNTAQPAVFCRADCTEINGARLLQQYQASASVMIDSAGVFKAAYHDNKWLECGGFIDMACSDAGALDVIFRAFHEILTSLEASVYRLRYFFFSWLADQDLRRLVKDDVSFALVSCRRFGHYPGVCMINMICTSQKMHPALASYMPIMVRSLRQWSEILFLEREVSKSDYATFGFSPRFYDKYGKPFGYWTDFCTLTQVSIRSLVMPKNKDMSKAWEKLRGKQFLEFAYEVDDTSKSKGFPKVWRKEMEGAWVQNAFDLYDKEASRLGDEFQSNKFVAEGLQASLKKIIGKRFHPLTKVEKYWANKGDGWPEDLWTKKIGAWELATEMQFAQPRVGEGGVDMDDLYKQMGALQLTAASSDSQSPGMTAEEAMFQLYG